MKILIQLILLISICKSQPALTLIGHWEYKKYDEIKLREIVDVWQISANQYSDSVYFISKNGTKTLNASSAGFWKLSNDTIYVTDTIINGNKQNHDSSSGNYENLIKLTPDTLIVEAPVGIMTYKRIK